MDYISGSQRAVPRPVVPASAGSMWEMQIFRSHLRLPESEALWVMLMHVKIWEPSTRGSDRVTLPRSTGLYPVGLGRLSFFTEHSRAFTIWPQSAFPASSCSTSHHTSRAHLHLTSPFSNCILFFFSVLMHQLLPLSCPFTSPNLVNAIPLRISSYDLLPLSSEGFYDALLHPPSESLQVVYTLECYNSCDNTVFPVLYLMLHMWPLSLELSRFGVWLDSHCINLHIWRANFPNLLMQDFQLRARSPLSLPPSIPGRHVTECKHKSPPWVSDAP